MTPVLSALTVTLPTLSKRLPTTEPPSISARIWWARHAPAMVTQPLGSPILLADTEAPTATPSPAPVPAPIDAAAPPPAPAARAAEPASAWIAAVSEAESVTVELLVMSLPPLIFASVVETIVLLEPAPAPDAAMPAPAPPPTAPVPAKLKVLIVPFV